MSLEYQKVKKDVISDYINFRKDESKMTEVISLNKNQYFEKYVWPKYKNLVENKNMFLKDYYLWVAQLEKNIEQLKTISKFEKELKGDEFAVRAIIRRWGKEMIYQKLMEYMSSPDKISKLSLEEVRKLYSDIRREEDSDKALLLKAIETKQHKDEFDFIKDQMNYGFLNVESIKKIRARVYEVFIEVAKEQTSFKPNEEPAPANN